MLTWFTSQYVSYRMIKTESVYMSTKYTNAKQDLKNKMTLANTFNFAFAFLHKLLKC